MIQKNLFTIFALSTFFVGSLLAQSTEDCGVKFGCYLAPKGCQNDNCNYIIKWANGSTANSIHFILNSKVDLRWWLAIGFSTDQKMGNDSVALCSLDKDVSQSTIETYYNKGHNSPTLVNASNPTAGLSYVSVSYTNGWLTCSFLREVKNPSLGGQFFDLNQQYYLLVAKGQVKDNNEPGYHHNNDGCSPKKINFFETSLVNANGGKFNLNRKKSSYKFSKLRR